MQDIALLMESLEGSYGSRTGKKIIFDPGYKMCIRDSFKIDQMLSSDYETKVEINKKELLGYQER